MDEEKRKTLLIDIIIKCISEISLDDDIPGEIEKYFESQIQNCTDPELLPLLNEACSIAKSFSREEILQLREAARAEQDVDDAKEFERMVAHVQKAIANVRDNYEELEKMILAMANRINKDNPDKVLDPTFFMKAFDIVLQYSLLQLAAADQKIDPLEVLYVKEITKYADFAAYLSEKYNIKELDWSLFLDNDIGKIKQILGNEEKNVQSIATQLEMMIAFFHLQLGEEFMKTMVGHMIEIVKELIVIDNDNSDAEAANGIFINKFLNDIVNYSAQMAKENQKEEEKQLSEPFDIVINEDNRFAANYLDKPRRKAGLLYIETESGSGSGFVINSEGYAITCHHVTGGAKKIFVRTEGEERQVFKAHNVFLNEENDFAIIKIETEEKLNFYQIKTDCSNITDGDDIALYGFPYGRLLNQDAMELEPSLSKGYVSSKNKIMNTYCYYIDLNAMPGFSGGPIFDLADGKIIGYLCGNVGEERANICYMRSLEFFLSTFKKCEE